MTSAHQHGSVFFEFIAVGPQVKVTAVDATTGVEVSVVGPVSASYADLERVALAKLRARLAAKSKQTP
jgi:hypothetical protein